ncbi:MAG: hypothetical protein HOM14_17225 [Gammaproteobacteria bacterium]|jgi:hypothetical protein|nr:hypothetical protein [Gammaproteobacteria bacterium]MBT3723124.1 hypothetical protein [Gammaproteobacteria bacterium]MBT4192719.1 hypothetical protein [Gammaproteobacteria bacterium]MBT4451728.1 hypothetical protein [Gammaproteobacteria bacterium]MBT4862998.1 hypothetical protein [Gammaproteobacteria bacterium]
MIINIKSVSLIMLMSCAYPVIPSYADSGSFSGGAKGGDQCMVEAAKVYLDCAANGSKSGAIKAVDLIAAWINGGAPKEKKFEYIGADGDDYNGQFDIDVLPLFTTAGIWFKGSRSCASCHFDNSENSYHEMDLTSYEGLMKGGDVLSHPPGVPLFGQGNHGAAYDWSHSKLRARLRNNRMPPGWPEDLTEVNRDGPCMKVSNGVAEVVKKGDSPTYGCDLNALGLLETWTKAGAPKKSKFKFGGKKVSFTKSVLPLFTTHGIWFKGSQSCSSCHFNNSENSYHEMNLSSYEGIMQGGDVLSKPPGVPLLGQSKIGARDFNWSMSKMKARLRNNRMSPGMEFDITEENRDGPLVFRGKRVE